LLETSRSSLTVNKLQRLDGFASGRRARTDRQRAGVQATIRDRIIGVPCIE